MKLLGSQSVRRSKTWVRDERDLVKKDPANPATTFSIFPTDRELLPLQMKHPITGLPHNIEFANTYLST